jgi:hypothetical protein
MCLIVDTNVAHMIFSTSPHADFEPVQRSLFAKKARAFYGGELAREYGRMIKLGPLLAELDRQGIILQVSNVAVDDATEQVRREGNCVSNDPHIIGLAKVSACRLLCSNDVLLHKDFTNPALLKPHGTVYQSASHSHLIRKHCKPR